MIRDEEKKNDICRPFNLPVLPLDFFSSFLNDLVNSGKVGAELGLLWSLRRRTSLMHHMSYFGLAKLIWLIVTQTKPLVEKLSLWNEKFGGLGRRA